MSTYTLGQSGAGRERTDMDEETVKILLGDIVRQIKISNRYLSALVGEAYTEEDIEEE